MNGLLGNAVTVSIISMSVIFLVLSILIITIKLLVRLLPYEAPPPKPIKKTAASQAAAATTSEADEHIAAITGAMTAHLGQNPGHLDIKPL